MKKNSMTFKTMLFTLWARPLRIFRNDCGSDEKGSAVVEAVLTVPIFLGAICTLLALGQMLFAQTQILHSLSQTADQLVQFEEKENSNPLLSTSYAYSTFRSILRDHQVCDLCVKGGVNGIILLQNTNEDTMDLTISYYMKVPVPYFNRLGFIVHKTIHRRLFTGYMEHDQVGSQSDPIVYIAQYGTVYHKTMSCSKICIRIADPTMVDSLIKVKKYQACEKCMKKNIAYAQVYITVQGDAVHSTLTCSGLKRTIRAVHLSEVKGLGLCKNCGKE